QRPALVLRLAGMAEFRIGAVLQQEVGAFLVIKDAAEPVAGSAGREPRRDTRLAHGIDVYAQIDQLCEQVIPAAISRPEQGIFPERRLALRLHAKLEKEVDDLGRLRFCEQVLTDPMIS